MRTETLWRQYPRLYHVAWGGSWPSIKENGLLSATALLRSCGRSPADIAMHTQMRRAHWVTIECQGHPAATLRDQKPLSDNGLRAALPDSVEPREWYELINSMVFFWPTKERLETMITAKAYSEVQHDVLIIDTEKLVRSVERNIRLSHMNSGCTRPYPHPRDTNLFQPIHKFPYEISRKKRGKAKAIAEVCVLERVAGIQDTVIDVKRGLGRDILALLTP